MKTIGSAWVGRVVLGAWTVLGVVASACVGVGCAATSVERPDGFRYTSTKDMAVGRLEVEEFYPDGKPKLKLMLDNGVGNASGVNTGNWQGFQAALQQGVQIGAAMARGAMGLPTLPPTPTESPPPTRPPPASPPGRTRPPPPPDAGEARTPTSDDR